MSEVLETTQEALEFFQLFADNSSQLIEDILMSMELDLLQLLKVILWHLQMILFLYICNF